MKRETLKNISVRMGDITEEDTDAIVNAANTSLLGGGGVDGAIHKAAGPELLARCRLFGGCNPGETRITEGYRLKAKYVIHTPGPVYRGGKAGEEIILKNSYINSMKLAMDYGLKSISFPAISTGVYGYPKKEACKTAVDTVTEFMEKMNFMIKVNFVLYDEDNFRIYKEYIDLLKQQSEI